MTNTDSEREQAAWRDHEISQLLYFRSLSLRDKILALEQMQKTVEQLQTTRAKRVSECNNHSSTKTLAAGDRDEEHQS
jgi:hypothetical protein